MSESHVRTRGGFTMLTMIWILSFASIIAMTGAAAGRTAVASASNRVNAERARWSAIGCARRMQAAIDSTLSNGASSEATAVAWRTLNRTATLSTLIDGCSVTLEAAGTRIDVNAATDEMMLNLLADLEYEDAAQEMDSAFRARRDQGPLADSRELSRVRGFEEFARFDSLVSTEPGRVSLAAAPAAVLRVIPGITAEAADTIVGRQQAGVPFAALLDVIDAVSVASGDVLAAHYPEAARLTTPDPDAWIIRSRAANGLPPVTETLQWRVVRLGAHVVVTAVQSIP